MGWLAHAIFSKSGGYPPVMVKTIASNSELEGRHWSRLPEMSLEWKTFIRGSADFLGINYYTSRIVTMNNNSYTTKNPSWEKDLNIREHIDPAWPQAKSPWLYSVPHGLGELLR